MSNLKDLRVSLPFASCQNWRSSRAKNRHRGTQCTIDKTTLITPSIFGNWHVELDESDDARCVARRGPRAKALANPRYRGSLNLSNSEELNVSLDGEGKTVQCGISDCAEYIFIRRNGFGPIAPGGASDVPTLGATQLPDVGFGFLDEHGHFVDGEWSKKRNGFSNLICEMYRWQSFVLWSW